MSDLTKRVTERLKSTRCSQPNCRSDSQDTLEVVVFGEMNSDKRGFMCTSCFLEENIIPQLNRVEFNVLPVRKFLKRLTEAYAAYRQLKESGAWQPNLNESIRKEIKAVLTTNEAELNKRIAEVLQVVQKEVDAAVAEARLNNTDKDFEKVLEFVQRTRTVDPRDSLLSLSQRVVKLNSEYSYTGEQLVKQGNQRISQRISGIIKLAEDTIIRLIELHSKQLQRL